MSDGIRNRGKGVRVEPLVEGVGKDNDNGRPGEMREQKCRENMRGDYWSVR